jgi:hypothetical protein
MQSTYILMCNTLSTLLIGYAEFSNPILHATHGLSHPLSVVSVLNTNFGLLFSLKHSNTATTTTKSNMWSAPPTFSSVFRTLRKPRLQMVKVNKKPMSSSVICHRWGS